MNIQKIKISDIDVGDRLREVDECAAEMIAASFREIGQRTPVEVRKGDDGKYKLITGAHRVRGAELAELPHVLAIVREVTNAQAELIEIDENLLRADLTVLDRAVFLARRKELYEALHPTTKHGGDRRSDQIAEFCDLNPVRFSEDAAERLGVSERSVQQAIMRAKRITKAARKRLSGTRFANKGGELDALAELETEDEQLRAIALVLPEDGAQAAHSTLRAAVDDVLGIQADAVDVHQKVYDGFVRTWAKMSPAVKRRIVAFVTAEKRKIKDEVAAEGGEP